MKILKNKTLRVLVAFMLTVLISITSTASVFAANANTITNTANGNTVSSTTDGYYESTDEFVDTKGEIIEGEWGETNGNDWGTGENVEINRTSRIYNTGADIIYEKGATYTMDIYVNYMQAFSCFNFDIEMPYYVRIENVRPGASINYETTFIYNISDDGSLASISYTSQENDIAGFSGDASIVSIDFSIREEVQASEAPRINVINFGYINGEVVNEFYFSSIETYAISVNWNGENPPPTTRMKGDIDGNGIVDLQDLIEIQRGIVEKREFGELHYCADINNDDTVNIIDCQYIQMYITGKINSLENFGGGNQGEYDPTKQCIVNIYLCSRTGNSYGGDFSTSTDPFDSFSLTVERGRTVGEVVEPYRTVQEDYAGVYSSFEFHNLNPLDENMIIEKNMELYLLFDHSVQPNSNLVLYVDGTFVDNSETYIEFGASIKNELISLLKNRNYLDFGTLEGIYTDAEMKIPVSDSAIMTESEIVPTFYVNILSDSIVGTYNVFEYINNSEVQKGILNIVDGTKGTYTKADGNVVSFTYTHVAGSVIATVSETEMYGFQFRKDSEGATTVYLMMEFNGSDLEENELCAAVAGAGYELDMQGTIVSVELTSKGLAKLSAEGTEILGSFSVDKITDEIAYGTLVIMDSPAPVIINKTERTITVNMGAMYLQQASNLNNDSNWVGNIRSGNNSITIQNTHSIQQLTINENGETQEWFSEKGNIYYQVVNGYATIIEDSTACAQLFDINKALINNALVALQNIPVEELHTNTDDTASIIEVVAKPATKVYVEGFGEVEGFVVRVIISNTENGTMIDSIYIDFAHGENYELMSFEIQLNKANVVLPPIMSDTNSDKVDIPTTETENKDNSGYIDANGQIKNVVG